MMGCKNFETESDRSSDYSNALSYVSPTYFGSDEEDGESDDDFKDENDNLLRLDSHHTSIELDSITSPRDLDETFDYSDVQSKSSTNDVHCINTETEAIKAITQSNDSASESWNLPMKFRKSMSTFSPYIFKNNFSGFPDFDDALIIGRSNFQQLVVFSIEPVASSSYGSTYISYKLLIRGSLLSNPVKDFTIQRRYRQFHWLQSELAYAHPGTIVPSLPGKNYKERFNPKFINNRMKGLSKFITQVASHAALSCNALFVKFIQYDETDVNLMIRSFDSERSEVAMLLRRWTEQKMLQLKLPLTTLPISPNITRLVEKALCDIYSLENISLNLNKKAKALNLTQRTVAQSSRDFSIWFVKLRDFQISGNGISSALQLIQERSLKYAAILQDIMTCQYIEVVEPFQDRLLLIRSMKLAAKVVLGKELQYLISLRKYKISDWIGNSTVHLEDDELEQFDEHLGALMCENSLEEWNHAATTFIGDYKKYTKSMSDDLMESIINLAVNEANRHSRSLKIWGETLETLKNICDLNCSVEATKELFKDNKSFDSEFNIQSGDDDLTQRSAVYEYNVLGSHITVTEP